MGSSHDFGLPHGEAELAAGITRVEHTLWMCFEKQPEGFFFLAKDTTEKMILVFFFINPEVIYMEDLYYICINNQHSPVAVKRFDAEELVATLFNISWILL